MSSPSIRPRPGRPTGSSRYQNSDPRLLRQVADKLLANPALSTRAAILQVLGKHDPAALRRLQDKFRPKDQWLTQARERAAETARRQVEAREALENGAVWFAQEAQRLKDNPTIRAWVEAAQRAASDPLVIEAQRSAGVAGASFMEGVQQLRSKLESSGVLKQLELMQRWAASPQGQELLETHRQMANAIAKVPPPFR